MRTIPNILITALLLFLLVSFAQAVKVGVVIDFPNQASFTKCLDLSEGSNGYDLLEATGLDIDWSPPSQWGHGLCGIESVGCTTDNCFCGGSEYWGIYLREKGENSWEYLPVGFDAGSECWNRNQNSFEGHYCIAEGDVFGLRWGTYDQLPEKKSFNELCNPKRRKREVKELQVSLDPRNPRVDQQVLIHTGEKKAEIRILTESGKKVFDTVTDEDGTANLVMTKAGIYDILINARGYPHTYVDLVVSASSTSTISTSTILPTTISPPKEISTIPFESTVSSTTTISSTSSSTISQEDEKIKVVVKDLTGRVVDQNQKVGGGNLKKAGIVILLLVIATLAALFMKN